MENFLPEADLADSIPRGQEMEWTPGGAGSIWQGNLNAELNEISAALWRERKILGLLLSTVEEQKRGLLSLQDDSEMAHLTTQLERLGEQLCWELLHRAVLVHALLEDQESDHELTLWEIAFQTSNGPWEFIFTSHWESLTVLVDRIEAAKKINEKILQTRCSRPARTVTARLIPSALKAFLHEPLR